LALILYVDDLFLTGSHTIKIAWLGHQLQTKFQMTDLEKISTYLGIEFEFTSIGLQFHQTKFAQSIFLDSGMDAANSTVMPLPDGTTCRSPHLPITCRQTDISYSHPS
jgi:hypothetical protein